MNTVRGEPGPSNALGERHDLAFLHTSPVHVAGFDALVQKAWPGLRVRHDVHEALLARARAVGPDDPALIAQVEQAMHHAASSGAAVVVCTCSTIGAAAERTDSGNAFAVARIDRAMADRAVARGERILIVAALESTLAPTRELIHESAARAARRPDIRCVHVTNAWPLFESGDTSAYLWVLADAVLASAGDADVVVLAQASMAPVGELLAGRLHCAVLSSPEIGVRSALDMLIRRSG